MNSNQQEMFKARAFDEDGTINGNIDGVPMGNIQEFMSAHMTGKPWEPAEGRAETVLVMRDE